MGKRGRTYRGLVGRPEGKRQLGRPRCKWEDNIKLIFSKGGMNLLGLAKGRDWCRAVVNTVMKLRIP
jgi:hypothetical protein